MKKIIFVLAIALAAPTAAHAAETPAKACCCCKEMKGDCCCDKKGEKETGHADHKDMQH